MSNAEPALVAAAQYTPVAGEVAANLWQARELIGEAASRGARLVVLPEYAFSGYDRDWIVAGAPGAANVVNNHLIVGLAEYAERLDISVVVNDLERSGDDLYSTSVLLARGSVLGRHRKTTITDKEQRAGLRAGDQRAPVLTLPGLDLPVAPMICFEHGFPEIALDLALAGAGLIAISSLINTGYEYLRNLRTRARAQDNGVYVVAANAAGDGYCGESMIVDPRGEVIARASSDKTEVVVAPVDRALVERQRHLEPVLQLRRPELRRLTA